MTHVTGYLDPDYLQLVAETVGRHKRRTYDLMHISPGHKTLDVGCGPGTDTLQLADLVGETGHVTGVDVDPHLIHQANHRAVEAGVHQWTAHTLADANALPFDANHFDSARSERLFQHLPNAQTALAEMIRVTRPAGWIVVLDTDWSTLSIDTHLIDIEQRLKGYHVAHGTHNGYAGRQLYRLFRQAGLTDIHVEMAPTFSTDYTLMRQTVLLGETEQAALSAGVITPDELAAWHQSLEQAEAGGVYFGFFNQVIVAGRRP